MSRTIPKIKITPSTDVSQYVDKPLTHSQVLARLDWIGRCIPVHQDSKTWLSWAFLRMEELNERLKDFQKHNRVAA